MIDLDDAAGLASEMATELGDLRRGFAALAAYYDGEHKMMSEPSRLTARHRELLAESVTNWCRLVVDVVAERLIVSAIRSSANPESDDQAWKYWQCNKLDAASVQVHTESLKLGVCYVAVWPGKRGPRITAESPMLCHVRHDEVSGEPTAALKVWQSRYGKRYTYATLYLPDAVYRFRSAAGAGVTAVPYTPRADVSAPLSGTRWIPRDADDDGGPVIANPLGVVPFVKFANQPDLLGGYTSEIAGILPVQDRINRTVFHRLLCQEFSAAPQRYVCGLDVDTDDEGQPRQPYDTAVDRLWIASDPETKFGQFPPASTADHQAATTADVQAIATTSRTPPHYLLSGMGVFPSGESVRATEHGLSRKVEDRRQVDGEAWEQTVRLAARADKNTRLATDEELEIAWSDVEARSEGELVDALLKMASLGVPRQVLWERWGASPQELDRWAELARAEADEEAGLLYDPGLGMSMGKAGPPQARDAARA